MHLQLTGRLEPGETYAQIDLDAANILPRGGPFVSLELVNIIICKQEDHDHFEPVKKADYPEDPNGYEETITVRRPRPQPLVFRRRTAIHVPNLEPPRQPEDEPPPPPQRERRDVGDNDDNEEEAEEEEELGELELKYAAVFKESMFEFVIEQFPDLSLESLVTNVLQTKHSPAVQNHFQRLLHHPPTYDLIDPLTAEEIKQRKKRVQIKLPPRTRLMCQDPQFFVYLGLLESATELTEPHGFYALVNDTMTTTKTFTSTVSLSTALKYSFYDRNKQPADKFTLIFQRLNPLVVSTVSLPNFCDKNPVATARLFQMILNCVMEALDLPDACLRAFLLDDGLTIELDKPAYLLNRDDSQDNFQVSVKFGTTLAKLLGVPEDFVIWKVSPRTAYQAKLEKNELPEDADTCDTVLDGIKDEFLNQKSSHPTVQTWKRYYDDRKAAGAAARPPPPPDDDDGNVDPFDVGGDEFEFDIGGRRVDQGDNDDGFELVQIPNPRPRPPASFDVANSRRKHVCTMPDVFPEYFTLVVREGEPLDHLTASRGLCSVLGLVRKLQPNIVPNNCVVRNVQSLKSLSIEFVDESLNTIKVAPKSPAVWIKLDLKCRSSTAAAAAPGGMQY